ncbi:restriction endonuclease subunit S [Vibrio sp. G41H]|uniref:restriction endonuclease subunit S n=1 Tax=unclassified Vibrio TaxID=2614977 RepID=UPI001AD70D8A|nr:MULTISPECIES: restriction endonuclease subunit S [unclassified Vibrio]MBO7910484.1 restriction endonuclease subunit S [Vibrio sp. G41H]MCF7489316.1 restriction endonuclease subunit S [Vibrio sp. G-C-1]
MTELLNMPQYKTYKASGYLWIGNVPNEWEVTKLGACLSPVSIKNQANLPLLSITRELGVIVRDINDQESNHNFIPEDLSGYKLLENGQFGMNKMKAWQGSYGVSKHTGIVSPAYYVFNFTKVIHPEFFNWAIRSKLYVSFFGSASDGVRIGQWDLSKERMKAIPFLLPSKSEQVAITDFLDKKTDQIDEAVAIKQQQIELLKERKQIIIQQAVTQGLEPNLPLKDSGIDWIGKTPEHWEIIKLKHLFTEVNKRTKTGKEILFSLRMIQGLVPHDSVSDKPIPDESLIDYKIVEPSQLVMNRMRASIGIFGVAENHGLVSPDYAVFDISSNADKTYFLKLFKTTLMGTQFRLNSRGLGTGSSGFMRLYTESFGDIKIPFPSFGEQLKINKHIAEHEKKIEQATELLESQIKKLKEYKTTLINSAVTGKIKVPQAQDCVLS